MNYEKIKHILYAFGLFMLVSSLCLWAWNTLAELYGGPHAQYKHVVAAIVFALFARWIIFGRPYLHREQKLFGHKVNDA